ncbi:MAG: alanyl-tRNA editing protein [Gammaproteobacteria bacterium]|nr:alanyl-tRNA editing protein [Gammaproteobacteria bacterium]
MTTALFREDSYLQSCTGVVTSTSEQGFCVDQTVFYPLGGGQPGDTGTASWDQKKIVVVGTQNSADGIVHIIEPGDAVPPVGSTVELTLDWDRRFAHMRMHTALHLLGSILKYGVTGGNISAIKSRLDFDTEDSVDKESVSAALNALVAANHSVQCRWISEQELDENPSLVRTMSVQPPRGKGDIRLLEIESVDLQPCGGTHVRSTGEIGAIRIGKVEKKGRRNRRVNIHFAD